MSYTRYRRHFLSNTEKYLPYIYPILMPILTLYAFKIPVQSFQDSLTYWLYTGFLQLILLVVTQRIVYLTTYNKLIRWLIAYIIGWLIIFIYLFLENNFFHFTARFAHIQKWVPAFRNSLNIVIFIGLLESVKSAAERRKFIVNNILLKNENAQAQLNLLLQQINPHFLFNCLTVLQAMTRSKDERTEAFIEKLQEVYRQTLKTDKGTVTLKEELDFFYAYMYLMGLRQENAVFVAVQVPDESLAYHLPVFSLQLLAENCIKHNIVSASKPLSIRLYQKDPKSLTIENNIQPKKQKNESFGIGIENLKKRYALEGIVKGVQIEKDEKIYSTTIKLL